MIIEALIYGVILIAKIEKLLNAPPATISKNPKILACPVNCWIIELSIPGTGMCAPIRNTKNINSVKIIFLRVSSTFKAARKVDNIRSPLRFRLQPQF